MGFWLQFVFCLVALSFAGKMDKEAIGPAFVDLDKEATGFPDAQPVRAMLQRTLLGLQAAQDAQKTQHQFNAGSM